MWNAMLDFLCQAYRKMLTKGEVLSEIYKLFIVTTKMIMLRDLIISNQLESSPCRNYLFEWRKFVQSYHEVNLIRIPCWVQYISQCSAELHVFADASVEAYTGVVYIQVEVPGHFIVLHFTPSVRALWSSFRFAPFETWISLGVLLDGFYYFFIMAC